MKCELCIQASKWRIAGVAGLGVSALDLAAGLGVAWRLLAGAAQAGAGRLSVCARGLTGVVPRAALRAFARAAWPYDIHRPTAFTLVLGLSKYLYRYKIAIDSTM